MHSTLAVFTPALFHADTEVTLHTRSHGLKEIPQFWNLSPMMHTLHHQFAKYAEDNCPDVAPSVYTRACTVHLQQKPNIHILWAAYEEKRGDVCTRPLPLLVLML